MPDHYKIAIIGSGPAGLSAAARAARMGVSHILIERAPHLADTIFKYFRGKLVMATPDNLDLRSDLGFKQSLREDVLKTWEDGLAGLGLNCRLDTEVTAVTGQQGAFAIGLGGGKAITADYVVVGVARDCRRIRIE